jgi:hypothetical protein
MAGSYPSADRRQDGGDRHEAGHRLESAEGPAAALEAVGAALLLRRVQVGDHRAALAATNAPPMARRTRKPMIAASRTRAAVLLPCVRSQLSQCLDEELSAVRDFLRTLEESVGPA